MSSKNEPEISCILIDEIEKAVKIVLLAFKGDVFVKNMLSDVPSKLEEIREINLKLRLWGRSLEKELKSLKEEE